MTISAKDAGNSNNLKHQRFLFSSRLGSKLSLLIIPSSKLDKVGQGSSSKCLGQIAK
jgi:hypothetical protein